MTATALKTKIEKRLGVRIVRKRGAVGPGQTKLGWFAIHPCKDVWLGRSLGEVVAKLDAHARRVAPVHGIYRARRA